MRICTIAYAYTCRWCCPPQAAFVPEGTNRIEQIFPGKRVHVRLAPGVLALSENVRMRASAAFLMEVTMTFNAPPSPTLLQKLSF
jgi:hypothetical protein